MSVLRSSRVRWWAIAGLWLLLTVVGVLGFLRQSRDLGLGRTFLDALYLTVQLPTAQYNGGPDAVNWLLEVARFGMPILTAGTLLQTASLVFADQFRRYRLRFARDHTIVCGLGDTGTRLAIAFADAGARVVAIENDPGAAGVAQAREREIPVLIGEATDRTLLGIARVDRASRLIAVSGADATNVQIALAATEMVGDRPGKALRCSVHLTDASLTTLLRSADLDAQGSVRLAFFNVHERAARALLAEHPPFAASAVASDPGPDPVPDLEHRHVVVIGLGQLGRSLVVALAQQWIELGSPEPLRLSLVDRLARGRWESLVLQHPALAEVAAPDFVEVDLVEPSAEGIAQLRALFDRRRPTWIAVTSAEEAVALSAALVVHQSLAPTGTTIVVRTRTKAWLDALLNPRTGIAAPFPGLRLFPFLERTCTPDAIDGGVREQLAHAMHLDYLTHASPDGERDSTMRRPWEELDDDERDPSRRRVDGIVAALAEIDCELGPLRRWGSPQTILTEAEIEHLAAFEHRRWLADRTAAGWTYGDVRDDARKRNPMLVEWESVTPAVREMNIITARALPSLLARAGFEPVRRGRGLVSLEL